MTKILSLLCFLIISGYGYSQRTDAPRYKIELRNSDTQYLSPTRKQIAQIRVVFKTDDSLSFGALPFLKGNETLTLTGDSHPSEWFSNYCHTRFSNGNDPKGTYLTWVLHKLSMSSDSSCQAIFTHVVAEIYDGPGGNNKASVPLQVDTVLYRANLDSLSYGEGVASALDMLYAVSCESMQEPAKNNRFMSTSPSKELDTRSLSAASSIPRIFADSVYEKGIYKTYQEFLDNSPSIKGAIWARPDSLGGNGNALLYRMENDSSVSEVKDVWGVCFGGNEIYKRRGNQLVPIEKSGGGFVLSRYQDYNIRKNQALVWRQVMYNAWPNDTNPYERKRSISLRTFKGKELPNGVQPIATKLDMATGELSF